MRRRVSDRSLQTLLASGWAEDSVQMRLAADLRDARARLAALEAIAAKAPEWAKVLDALHAETRDGLALVLAQDVRAALARLDAGGGR